MTEEQQALDEYRRLLTQTEQEAQSDFDKTVLTLSGGALGLSFAFIKDVIGTENVVHTDYLLGAWICWGVSSTSVLLSFFTSQMALRKAIRQLDDGKFGSNHEKMERPGGWYDWVTAKLNFAGLLLFLFGLVAMVCFLRFNLKDHMAKKPINAPSIQASSATVTPSVSVSKTSVLKNEK